MISASVNLLSFMSVSLTLTDSNSYPVTKKLIVFRIKMA